MLVNTYRRSFLYLITMFFVQILLCSPGMTYQTERVVLVIIDGLRYSEGLGDPDHQYVPRMAALAEEGAIVADFRNDGQTYTSRAIPAIWCGAWTEIHTFSDPDCNGASNNYTELPTVFEYYRRQLFKPETDCIYTLLELCPWRASFDPNYGPEYWPLYHSEGHSDVEVWEETRFVLYQYSPSLLLMYLADVDHGGHSGNWNEYTSSISIADSIVGELWDTLQDDPDYTGKTTMLVTNDHGRHDWDFSGHGDDCEGCRHIQLLAIGPDIEAGLVSDIPRVIPDIAPTIGELLGFTTESATGSAMIELLDEVIVSVDPIQKPQGLSLSAFPNPFNPNTTISYSVGSRAEVVLSIHDIGGGEIATLLDRSHAAGEYHLHWDGTDAAGNAVSTGVYFIRLQSGNSSTTTKIIFLQ